MDSIGQKLKKTRIIKNLKISDVSKELRISEEILNNFETEHLQKDINPVFLIGHLRSYCSFLKLDEKEIVKQMIPYIENQYQNGNKVSKITRHMLGLFSGRPGAKGWRKVLSENAHSSGPEIVLQALSEVE